MEHRSGGSACWGCGSICWQRCENCKRAFYCSSKCQRIDRPMHRALCAPDSMKNAGAQGIANLASTCYMASSLQLLAALPPIRDLFLSSRWMTRQPAPRDSVHQVALAFRDFLLAWAQPSGPIDLTKFFKVVSRHSSFKHPQDQEDAQEFLSWLLDNLHDRVDEKEKYIDTEKKPSESLKAWHDRILPKIQPNPKTSPLLATYGGLFINKSQCLNCRKHSMTFEPFSLIPVSLPPTCQVSARIWYVPLKGSPITTWLQVPVTPTHKELREIFSKHFDVAPTHCLMGLLDEHDGLRPLHASRTIVLATLRQEAMDKETAAKEKAVERCEGLAEMDSEIICMKESDTPPIFVVHESAFPWIYPEIHERTHEGQPFLPRPHSLNKSDGTWRSPMSSRRPQDSCVVAALAHVFAVRCRWRWHSSDRPSWTLPAACEKARVGLWPPWVIYKRLNEQRLIGNIIEDEQRDLLNRAFEWDYGLAEDCWRAGYALPLASQIEAQPTHLDFLIAVPRWCTRQQLGEVIKWKLANSGAADRPVLSSKEELSNLMLERPHDGSLKRRLRMLEKIEERVGDSVSLEEIRCHQIICSRREVGLSRARRETVESFKSAEESPQAPEELNDEFVSNGGDSPLLQEEAQGDDVAFDVSMTTPECLICYKCPLSAACAGCDKITGAFTPGRSNLSRSETHLVEWTTKSPMLFLPTLTSFYRAFSKGTMPLIEDFDSLSLEHSETELFDDPFRLGLRENWTEETEKLMADLEAGGEGTFEESSVVPLMAVQLFYNLIGKCMSEVLRTNSAQPALRVDLSPTTSLYSDSGVLNKVEASQLIARTSLWATSDLIAKLIQVGRPPDVRAVPLEVLLYWAQADEILRGENAWRCCQDKDVPSSYREHRVWAMQNIVTIQLKRFQHITELAPSHIKNRGRYIHDTYGPRMQKNKRTVDIPIDSFDLSVFEESNTEGMKKKYHLVGCVCHEGDVYGGHYTAFTRLEPNGPWREYDDEFCQDVPTSLPQRSQSSCYLLAYTKSNS